MGEKLANAPVFLTAAQVRHNPILSFDNYTAQLQERFRKIGFTDYKCKSQSGFEINISNPADVKVKPQETQQHSFLNKEGSAGFVLEHSRLYFQVTEYDVYETFREQFLAGLNLLHTVVTLDFIDAVSMRLLDAIIPDANEQLSDYMATELLGIGEVLNDQTWAIRHSASESLISTREHKIVIRTLLRNGKLAVPPDLNISGMKIMSRFSEFSGIHAILDTDCIFETRSSFDIEAISSRLRLLKDDLRTTFQSAVSPHAMSRWS